MDSKPAHNTPDAAWPAIYTA